MVGSICVLPAIIRQHSDEVVRFGADRVARKSITALADDSANGCAGSG